MYQDTRNRFSKEIGTYIEDNWMRYLDDCYINWTFGEQRLTVVNELLNSLNTNISFTVECSKEQIAFLNVLIKTDKDRLTTNINYKITDTKQYLHYQSNHPRHIKRNIPYNLARIICTIVDTDRDKERRLDKLSELLAKRGYPKDLINFGINKAKISKLEDLRGSRAPANSYNVLAVVSTFNPNNPPIDPLLKTGMQLSKGSPTMKAILQRLKFIHSRRQSPYLQQLLVRSKFSDNQNMK